MSLHTVALVSQFGDTMSAYVDKLPGCPNDFSLLLFNSEEDAAEILAMIKESEPTSHDFETVRLPVPTCFELIQSLRKQVSSRGEKVEYIAFLTLNHRSGEQTEVMADFIPINDIVKGGTAGFAKILQRMEKRTQKRGKRPNQSRRENPEQVAERLSSMMHDIPKFAEHITPDKTLEVPKNVTDPPTIGELKHVEKMLDMFKSNGAEFYRLTPTGTKIVFQLYLNDKEFDLVGLPAYPGKITGGEFWGIRIMLCLQHLGWKARNIMLDDRDFGERNPEMN